MKTYQVILVGVLFAVIALTQCHTSLAGTLSGTVYSLNGKINNPQLPNAVIRVDNSWSARSDTNGVYSIPDIPDGAHTVSVEHPGKKQAVKTGFSITGNTILNASMIDTVYVTQNGERIQVNIRQIKDMFPMNQSLNPYFWTIAHTPRPTFISRAHQQDSARIREGIGLGIADSSQSYIGSIERKMGQQFYFTSDSALAYDRGCIIECNNTMNTTIRSTWPDGTIRSTITSVTTGSPASTFAHEAGNILGSHQQDIWGPSMMNSGNNPSMTDRDEAYFNIINNHTLATQRGEQNLVLFDFTDNVTGVGEVFGASKPRDFYLQQNYPNPLNPSTTIRFQLPRQGLVSLKVYNMPGQVVATLVNESRQAGTHEVQFDASHLASGVYIYTMKAGDFVASKKLLLLK